MRKSAVFPTEGLWDKWEKLMRPGIEDRYPEPEEWRDDLIRCLQSASKDQIVFFHCMITETLAKVIDQE